MSKGGSLKVWFGDPGRPDTWHVDIAEAIPVPDHPGEFTAPNQHLHRDDSKFFDMTLVDETVVIGGVPTPIKKPVGFESDAGTNKVGDIPVVFRKNEASGRWFVDVRNESVYLSPTEKRTGLGIIRSSIDNFQQALKERMGKKILETVEKWGNTARHGGKPIQCHGLELGYSPQLAAEGKSVDVFVYRRDHIELLGAGAFMEALWALPSEMAHEIFLQSRDPNRVSK
jgi:hypothetical protein